MERGGKPMRIDETVHACLVSLASQVGESVWCVSFGGQLCGLTICVSFMLGLWVGLRMPLK